LYVWLDEEYKNGRGGRDKIVIFASSLVAYLALDSLVFLVALLVMSSAFAVQMKSQAGTRSVLLTNLISFEIEP